MSLEQLMSIEITSAARRPVSIVDTPAAAYVLTNDDIRRSGARSIPEALRMVPGLNVAQVTANSWAISSRGFNGRFANKLLVLIDGRSVYAPIFSGVFWDQQSMVLDDVERIEVIRGPGASLWGANAVNGVINIITKDARDTQGTYLSTTIGTNDEHRGEFRYGGPIGDLGYYRVFGKAFDEGDRTGSDGQNGADDWRSGSGGFRADLTDSGGDRWKLQGGTFSNVLGGAYTQHTLTAPYSQRQEGDLKSSGEFLQGAWTRQVGAGSQVEVRSYLQRTVLEDERFNEERTTFDIEADHSLTLAGRHKLIWGAGGRYSLDNLGDTALFTFEPDSDEQYMVNGFIQDTVGLWSDAVEITVGTKLEYNNYTGLELQPNARALWHVNERHTAWAAVSRAVRTPSRAENDVDLDLLVVPPSTPGGLPTDVRIVGSRSLVSEELLAFEVGHRWQADDALSFDLAAFFNSYDNLVTAATGAPYFSIAGGTPHIVVPLVANNDDQADVYGFELVANWRPRDDVNVQGWYALLLGNRNSSTDPEHQAAVRLQYNLSPTLAFDAMARYVGGIETLDVDPYTELGLRLAWRPQPNVELAIAGQNLLRTDHLEFGEDAGISGLGLSTRVERSIYGTATVRF